MNEQEERVPRAALRIGLEHSLARVSPYGLKRISNDQREELHEDRSFPRSGVNLQLGGYA